jgi:hypothetical protein
MWQTNKSPKRKRSKKALSVLGLVGLSLAAMPNGSGAITPAPLAEEEISDVTLATFSVLGSENLGLKPLLTEVRGCGCRGCRGCGFRGCRGCGFRGCRGCGFRGCRGCGCGGCRGCGSCCKCW